MSSFLPAPIPIETKATCGDCVMCPGKGAEPEEAFAVETKCSIFVPSIPNFLVGRALDDPGLADGRRSLAARIEKAGLSDAPALLHRLLDLGILAPAE